MKTPEEIINSFKTPHIADLGVDWIISKNKLETLIKITQKDAYNQAIDDCVNKLLSINHDFILEDLLGLKINK